MFELERVPTDGNGPDPVFLSLPEAERSPGLLLLHDADGIDDRIRALARLYAQEGYATFVPDLFWLRGIEARERAGEVLEWEDWYAESHEAVDAPAISCDVALEDIAIVLERMRAHPAVAGPAGIIGYGLGGTLALLAAHRLRVDAAVAYDPVPIERERLDLGRPAAPLLVHVAGGTPLELLDRLEATIHVHDDGARRLAHARTIAHLRRHLGPAFDLEGTWDAHVHALLARRDAARAVRLLTGDARVSCVPTRAGGHREFLERLALQLPAGATFVPVARTVGADHLVDELVLVFTHDRAVDALLPGVAPSGRRVELPLVATVTFRGPRIAHVRLYWDQASLLEQVGALPGGLPVLGSEEAHELLASGLTGSRTASS